MVFNILLLLVGTRDLWSKISILKKWKKNNIGIGPVKWNCLVHINKIIPKKKRKEKGGEKKRRLWKQQQNISPP
jgi:hypothetical protein